MITNQTATWILFAAYMIWWVPEMIYSIIHRAGINAKRVYDGHSTAVLIASIWVGVFLAQNFMYREPQFSISWQPELVFALGILLMILGVAFRWYAIQILGKFFTVQIATHPEQVVVEKGPYRFIRHPSYTGSLITMFGVGLACTNWLSLVSVLAAGLIGYSYRAYVEEGILTAELGDRYKEYMRRTKRFIPFVY